LRVLLPEELQKRIERILDAFIKEGEEVREYSFWDSTKVKKEEDWFVHNCPICTSSELEEDLRRKKEVFMDPAFAEGLRDEMLAFLIAHERGHRECLPKRGGEICASVEAVAMFRNRDLAKGLAREWYYRWWYSTPILEESKFLEAWKGLMEQLEGAEEGTR